MPLLLIGLAGLGSGFLLGFKTSEVTKVLIIGGVVYYVITRNK